MADVKGIKLEAGYITIAGDSGPPTKYPIADVLRAADIPVLTIEKLTLLTKLAELVVVITKTLIEREILDEDFEDGYDLQYIVDTLEADLATTW